MLLASVGTVEGECCRVSSSFINMTVNAVVANVHLPVYIPPFHVLVRFIKDFGRRLGPHQILSLLAPKIFFIFHGVFVLLVVELVGEIIGFLSVSDILR